MVRLVEAWKILSDPATRARYDQQVKYQHDGWRSRQHRDDVQEALKRAKDDASRAWPEFEAIYQKAFYAFNQDFFGKEISEKAAGPYSPLLRPKKTEYRSKPPAQKLTAENTITTVGGLLFIYAAKVLILFLATVATLLIYRQFAGKGRFVNLGQQGTAVISILDTTTGAIYSIDKTSGSLLFTWNKTVPPLSSQPLNRIR
jgi:curved DNA-binding protein CbpA